jgi:uncharacterized protein (UPF0332 family)
MFNWSHFFEVAQCLAETDDEASYRSALSRAYYAAFHHARMYLARIDPELQIPAHGGAHEAVPQQLKLQNRTRQAKNAGTKLDKLKRLRKWADYDDRSRTRLTDDVTQAIRDAQWIAVNLALED